MNIEQKQQIIYDRVNTRYNRLWEQVTNTGLFVLTVIAGYLIALKSVEKNLETILTLDQVNYILLFLAIIVGIISAVLMAYLIFTRKELNKFFNKNHIEI